MRTRSKPVGNLSRVFRHFLFGVLMLLGHIHMAYGYHFFEATNGGCRWATIGAGNVDFLVDGSSTAAIGTALLAEVTEARDAWNNIGTAQNVLGNFTQAAVDYTDTNFGTDWGMGHRGTAADAQNEVVLDETGDILRNVFGLDPSSINGFGPSVRQVSGSTCTITDAFNLLNGTRTDFDRRSTTVHEFGHIQGLAHSSVGEFNSRNNAASLGTYASPSAALEPIDIASVPTMHPFSNGTGTNRRTPEQDDIAGLSELYPEGTFLTTTGTIGGTITRCSDDSPVQGVNVRAVSVGNTGLQVTRYASFDSNADGRYIINGLPAGAYHVIVEPMGFNGFTTDKMAIQTALDSGFPTEFYGPTADEEANCSEATPDTPLAVNVSAGASHAANIKVHDGTDLAFVVDDTGSMSDEIAAVRTGLDAYITNVESHIATSGQPFPSVAIVTFKDGVTLRQISDNPATLRGIVSGLTASGGGDCPESSNAAMLEAGRILRPTGTSILYTDADSRPDGPTREAVIEYYRSQSKTQSVLLSATCSEEFVATTSGVARVATSRISPHFRQGGDVNSGTESSIERDSSQSPGSASFDEYPDPPMLGSEDAVTTFSQIAVDTNGIFKIIPRPTGGDATTAYVNAVTNIALSSIVPVVGVVNPGQGFQATQMLVTLTGINTNWSSASGVEFVGTSIVVNSVTAMTPTSIVADISIPASEPLGFVDVRVTTPLGGGATETAEGIGAFQVSSAPATASITSITPAVASIEFTVDVVIEGVNTSFSNGSAVRFLLGAADDPNITVNSVVALSASRLQVNISVSGVADIGLRDVSVDGTTALQSFLVSNPAAAIARLINVTPNQGNQGASGLLVTIQGENTNFASTSNLSFSGSGITVANINTMSATQLQATLNIDTGATLGFRDVFVSTGGEVAALLDGFQVNTGTVPPPAPVPTLSEWGTVLLVILLIGLGISPRMLRNRR